MAEPICAVLHAPDDRSDSAGAILDDRCDWMTGLIWRGHMPPRKIIPRQETFCKEQDVEIVAHNILEGLVGWNPLGNSRFSSEFELCLQREDMLITNPRQWDCTEALYLVSINALLLYDLSGRASVWQRDEAGRIWRWAELMTLPLLCGYGRRRCAEGAAKLRTPS